MAIAFLNKYETLFNNTGTKTLVPTTAVGDVFVIIGADDTNGTVTPFTTPSGTGLTVTSRQAINNHASANDLQVWTAVVTSGGTPTVSCTNSAGFDWAFVMYRYSGVNAVGASVGAPNNSTGNINLTTSVDNAAVILAMNDFSAGTAPTYLTTAGAFTTESHLQIAAAGSLDAGHYINAGLAGVKNVGASAPTSTWTIVAIELQPSIPVAVPPPSLIVNKALRRSTNY